MTDHLHDPFDGESLGEERGDAGGTPGGSGALTNEALRLVSSVRDWADSASRSHVQDPADAGATASYCQWCPLCQFAAMLRGERPEVTSRVAEAGSAVVAALRALVEAAADASGPGGHGGQHRHPDSSQQPRVQRIDLSDES